MTGFGEARLKVGSTVLVCLIRSLNHRFLEAKVRVPTSSLLGLEMAIRKLLSEEFRRGSFDVVISFSQAQGAARSIHFDEKQAKTYIELCQSVQKKLTRGQTCAPLSMDALFRLPHVLTELEPEKLVNEESILKKVVLPAIESLRKARLQEGVKLKEHLLKLTTNLETELCKIKQLEQPEKENARIRLTERANETIKTFFSQSTSPQLLEEFGKRLREEAAFWIERRDFEEERVRFETHLGSLKALLNQRSSSNQDSLGRRLEFLHQELFREVNTLGTKAQSTRIASHVLEIKSTLERFKEQIANVE